MKCLILFSGKNIIRFSLADFFLSCMLIINMGTVYFINFVNPYRTL